MIADALSWSSGYLARRASRSVEHEIAMEKEEIRLMPEIEEENCARIRRRRDPRTAAVASEVMQDPERRS